MKPNLKRPSFRVLIAVPLACLLAIALTGCGQAGKPTPIPTKEPKPLIEIAFPTKSSERWNRDGEFLMQQLQADGFTVNLQYADDAATQIGEISGVSGNRRTILIVGAVEGASLKSALASAHAAGATIIGFDQLPAELDGLDYYATFNQSKVGALQATSLLEGLAKSGAPQPWNVELFAGPAGDPNAALNFKGAMSVLQPAIDNGSIRIGSAKSDFASVATPSWDAAAAAASRLRSTLTDTYSTTKINGILSPRDAISRSLIATLDQAGYATAGAWPVVTGGGAELDSARLVLTRKQYSTVFSDTRRLAQSTVMMIQELASHTPVTTNDPSTYTRGGKAIPTVTLDSTSCIASDIAGILVAARYYTEDQLS